MEWPTHPNGYYWVRPLKEPLPEKVFSDWYIILWHPATAKFPPSVVTFGPSNDSIIEDSDKVQAFLESHEWGGLVAQPSRPTPKYV